MNRGRTIEKRIRRDSGQNGLLARGGSACGRQEGTAVVEFTLVLPILLLLLFGILDFGRAINYWIDETSMANQAARWAAVNKNPGPGSLQEAVRSTADTDELRGNAQVCLSFPSGGTVGEPVRADVTVDYSWMPFIGDQLGGITSTTLSGSATMRLEAAPSEYGAGCS